MIYWNTEWLTAQIALEDAILCAIRARKYSEENDYATAARSRERMADLERILEGESE